MKIKKIEPFWLDLFLIYCIQYIQKYILLIYIDVSVDRRMIDRYLADRDLIETSIIHILDDDIASLDPCDDTHMTIVAIVSCPWELHDSTYYWRRSRLDTISSSISHPGRCITMPGYIFVLGHIPGTVPSDESSWFASVFDGISILESCLRWDHHWWLLLDPSITRISYLCRSWWCGDFGWYLLSFFEDGYTPLHGSWDHEIHTDTDTRCITETIDWDDIIRIDTIFGGYLRYRISTHHRIDHSWYRRDFEDLSDLELITTFEIISPEDSIGTHSIFFGDTPDRLKSPDGMFFDIFVRYVGTHRCRRCDLTATLSRVPSSNTDESCIWYISISGDIAEIAICRDDRRLIIVSGTHRTSRSEEREGGVYREYDDECDREPLESTKCIRYRWEINIGSTGSCMTSSMIGAYGQSSILGINMSLGDISTFYILYSPKNLCNSRHREASLVCTESLSSHVAFFWFDFEYSDFVSLEMFDDLKRDLRSLDGRGTHLDRLAICTRNEESWESHSGSDVCWLAIDDECHIFFDCILFTTDFYYCYHRDEKLGSYEGSTVADTCAPHNEARYISLDHIQKQSSQERTVSVTWSRHCINFGSKVEENHLTNEGGIQNPMDPGDFVWLGMRDSNPRMAESKSAALPLGESPILELAEL